ncbi:DNA-processing protein DprA [Thiopseudomonas denitrificans]|uniref:DNA protecting protein DprA n=1 Tax=Thiopseudomonas denitrificans TaxID=1501432 RepID=A0A4R6U0T2_9GAMM|nr:DNA-processing protein DprA [Thiopseudomonas denitrificans]TDQ38223.1 DNA protecting protein DprA [Thiopseudomonas denitrificans]
MNTPSLAELQARLLLNSLPHIGPQRFLQLLAHYGDAVTACRSPAAGWRALNMPEPAIAARQEPELHAVAERATRWQEQDDCHILLHDGDGYPGLLGETAGAPPVIFVQGNVQLLQQPQLAIIGSRHASPAGERLAFEFARTMAASGCCITSGLALGIDSAAHRGALAVSGPTLAVVGTGLLRTYPARNRQLQAQIVAEGGAMVSELPLDTGPHASHFPRRNRIISGLSLGVLVVEAGVASGSLITARYAAEQGRDVFAIPGSVHYPGSKGCHQLIREGAILVETVQDILEQWQHWQQLPPSVTADIAEYEPHPVTDLLRGQPLNTEDLAMLLDADISELLTELTNLEIDGRIRQHGGQWFFMA